MTQFKGVQGSCSLGSTSRLGREERRKVLDPGTMRDKFRPLVDLCSPGWKPVLARYTLGLPLDREPWDRLLKPRVLPYRLLYRLMLTGGEETRTRCEASDQIEDLNMDNAKLLLQIDNARLAADDFKVKLEAEQAIGDGVHKDTQGLRKLIDDTNFLRMKLETEVETLREELAHLHKSHQEEVAALQSLIANNNVKVEVDGPKKSDLNESIAQIRSQYEKMAEQNRAEAENAYKKKFDSMSQEANANTKALDQAKNEVSDLRRQLQALDIEHQTLQKTVDSLDRVLKDTEDHYGSHLMELNRVLTALQDELAACRADIEHQVREYEALLNLKSKLEKEIHDYRTLLEGVTDKEEEPASPQPGEPNSQRIQKVTVSRMEVVDGKVVSSSSREEVNELH